MALSLNLARPGLATPALVLGPVFIIFVSSNVVNAGNLLFNILFSRWMGPELFGELATILTIKLALLGVLGALQIAVSHRVARTAPSETPALNAALARFSQCCFVALWLALPMLIAAAWLGDLTRHLGLASPHLLTLLLLSLPFAVPLSILRGVAYGRLDVARVLMSANLEMLVRLLGAICAWYGGLGLTGVVAAVAISIVVGWLPLCTYLPKPQRRDRSWTSVGRALNVAAIPFAFLQAGQVVLPEADVILARAYLAPEDAGHIAALSLFQRIQFFACFGLAGALLPAVAKAVAEGRSAIGPDLSTAALFACVSLVVLAAAALFPAKLVTLFVGPAFLAAAPVLLLAASAAVAFTLSYLLATFLSAVGDTRGIWLVSLACPVQLVAMSMGAESLAAMLTIKLGCQLALAGALLTLLLWRRWQPRAASPALPT